MIRTTLNYVRQNAIAFLALFVALSGTAFAAASLPKNSVGSKQIKKRAVTAAKVKNNTLTGTQINESKLKTVPNATSAVNATNAANADKLDGIDSTVFGTAQTVPGSVFQVRNETGGTSKSYVSTGSISALGGTEDFHYALNLPQGARVTSLDYRYVDNDAVQGNSITLYSFNSAGEASLDSDSWVTAVSTGASASRRTATAVPAEPTIIDNRKWSYVLVWSPGVTGVTSQLVGARVNYALP